ncbi:MAG: hypothetical protein HYS17_03010 [Micavibrio aeruginosavorus]|uniref:Uncharacterized protein n=1 Tax=Micavibrio aeruginosavorus TaxID=349221 RepID=A0A7T5R3A0_9BACT|nr:MAG: hypothetical protein HYS17_03010 [Micavibrio aeruginosavorus]
MKERDLQSIMQDMAIRLEGIQEDDCSYAGGLLSEVEAYKAVDSTLARLHKEFLDCRRNRLRALEQQGEGSAMADIARDLEDSAQSAIETRIIELRTDPIKRMMVERMMAQAHLQDMEEQRIASSKFYARRMAECHAEERHAQMLHLKRQREGEDSFLMLMLMWWMMRHTVWRTQLKLSLASSFVQAKDRLVAYEIRYAGNAA